MAFTKITSTELNSRGATTLPDAPTIPANQLKEEFDAPAKQVVAPKFNNLVDELEATSAAASIGMVAPTGRSGATVKAVVDDISSDLATVEGNQSTDEERLTTAEGKISDLEETAHTHSNKSLLDSYNQSNSDLSDAVSKKHSHSNKSLLDSYDQTNANIKDAVNKKHSHSNKSLLDSYTQTEANLADAVSKKHSHSNKSVLDKFTESSGNVLYNAIKLLTNAFSKIKVGNHTVTSSGDDTIEFVQGTNMVISADESGKKITFASSGGAGGGTWGAISGDIDDQQDLQDALDTKYNRSEANVLGAKNLLDLSSPISVNASSGVTYIRNKDGYRAYSSSGTFRRVEFVHEVPMNTQLTITADITVSAGTAELYFQLSTDGENWIDPTDIFDSYRTGTTTTTASLNGTGNTGSYKYIMFSLFCSRSGNTAGDVTSSKMMIRFADNTDASYSSAMTNQQLTDHVATKCENSSIAPIENGSTASQAYSVGSHFIRNGEYCKVTQAIASGGTLTPGTNYAVGTVADDLQVVESSFSSIVEGATVVTNKVYKYGRVAFGVLELSGVTKSSYNNFAMLKNGFRPIKKFYTINVSNSKFVQLTESGNVQSFVSLSNEGVMIMATWITE